MANSLRVSDVFKDPWHDYQQQYREYQDRLHQQRWYEERNKMMYYNSSWTGSDYTLSFDTATSYGASSTGAPAKPKEPTALDWLDGQIAEITKLAWAA